MVRCSLLNELPKCPKYVNTIEKVKENKVLKFVSTKDSEITGINCVLHQTAQYIKKIINKKKRNDVIANERAIGDEISQLQTKNELMDYMKSKKAVYNDLFPTCKNGLYKWASTLNALNLRRYLRVREKILEELNSDNNNVGILKKFLNKMKIAYKEDSGIIIDESKLIRLYEECRMEVLNDNN